MSRNARKRALIGFAEGFARTLQSAYQTKAAQEAELAKEQRLAAIRAAERGEDRAFQSQMTERQLAAQEARDARMAEQQAQRDERVFAQQTQRDAAQNEQRMREIEEGRKTQLAVAGTYQRPQQEETIILRTPDGGTVAMSLGDERLRNGLPPGYQMIEGRAGTRFQAIPEATGGSTTTVGGRQPLIGGQTNTRAGATPSMDAANIERPVWDEKTSSWKLPSQM